MERKLRSQAGLTLVELLVVIAIFSILTSVITVNLLRPQSSQSISSALNTLSADIRAQQLKSMMGRAENGVTATPHGIYFETGSYVLFAGDVYDSSDENNLRILLPDGVLISEVAFPSSQVVFARISGDVVSYSEGADFLVVQHTGTGVREKFSVNKYGSITKEKIE